MRFCYMELAESNMKQTVRLGDMAEINQYRKELRDKIIAYAMKEFHQRGVKAEVVNIRFCEIHSFLLTFFNSRYIVNDHYVVPLV